MKRMMAVIILVSLAFIAISGCASVQDTTKYAQSCQQALDRAQSIEQSGAFYAKQAEAAARRAEAATDKTEAPFKKHMKNGHRVMIPNFPWPPPPPSGTDTLPNSFFRKTTGKDSVRLADVDSKLKDALDACGYYERSYYAVPDGYALVTRLEQINEDGTSKSEAERWRFDIGPLQDFSLIPYVKSLFGCEQGFFRIIVFIVTPHPFSHANTKIDSSQATAWLDHGLNILPSEISRMPYTQEHNCTVLIYEFEKPKGQRDFSSRVPGRLLARKHLQKSAIWDKIQ